MDDITIKTRKKMDLIIHVILFLVMSLVYYVVMFLRSSDYTVSKAGLIAISWIGILIYLILMIVNYRKEKKIITPYSIFMTFLFLFNFGQCILWAFNIFLSDSIVESKLYLFPKPSYEDVFFTQVMVLMAFTAFDLGFNLIRPKNTSKNNDVEFTDNRTRRFFIFLSMVIIPITFYKLFLDYNVASVYGYKAMYYGENAGTVPEIIAVLSFLFFPSLIGLMLSSKGKYNKYVYLIYAIYIIVNLSIGERGTWIYGLFILVFVSRSINKRKINVKKTIAASITGYIGLYFVSAIRALRNSGISLATIASVLDFKNNPVVEFINEMGGTMGTTLVLNSYGWNIYPYGNTFFTSLLTMFSTRLINMFGVSFVPLSTWFSQEYLGIRYGAGFSIIAESLLNFGPIFLPFVMISLGVIISKLINKDSSSYYGVFKNSIILFSIISIVRNTMYYTLKQLFWGALIPIFIYKLFINKKTDKKGI